MADVTRKDIAQVVADKLAKGMNAKKLAKQLAQYLIEERRSGELEAIMRDVAAIRYAQDGVLEADVTSAFPLTAATKKEISKLLPAKNVIMNEAIDESLIGGAYVEAGSTLIDATMKRQLEQVKQGVN